MRRSNRVNECLYASIDPDFLSSSWGNRTWHRQVGKARKIAQKYMLTSSTLSLLDPPVQWRGQAGSNCSTQQGLKHARQHCYNRNPEPGTSNQIGKARKIAQKYMLTYGEPIPTQQLVAPNPSP